MIRPAWSGGMAAGGGVEVPGGRPDDAGCCGAAPGRDSMMRQPDSRTGAGAARSQGNFALCCSAGCVAAWRGPLWRGTMTVGGMRHYITYRAMITGRPASTRDRPQSGGTGCGASFTTATAAGVGSGVRRLLDGLTPHE